MDTISYQPHYIQHDIVGSASSHHDSDAPTKTHASTASRESHNNNKDGSLYSYHSNQIHDHIRVEAGRYVIVLRLLSSHPSHKYSNFTFWLRFWVQCGPMKKEAGWMNGLVHEKQIQLSHWLAFCTSTAVLMWLGYAASSHIPLM